MQRPVHQSVSVSCPSPVRVAWRTTVRSRRVARSDAATHATRGGLLQIGDVHATASMRCSFLQVFNALLQRRRAGAYSARAGQKAWWLETVFAVGPGPAALSTSHSEN